MDVKADVVARGDAGVSFAAIGRDHGLSRARIAQIYKKEKERLSREEYRGDDVRLCDVSARLRHALLNRGITDITEIERFTRVEAMSFGNFGRKTMEELEAEMLRRNLQFKKYEWKP